MFTRFPCQQADGIVLRHREMLVAQRTEAINALRGHAAEFSVVAAKGTVNVTALLEKLTADSTIPATAKAMFEQMGQHIDALDQRVATLDGELQVLHKANPVSRLLAEIPGIGPITVITMALTVEPNNFDSGRHFAAWLGLTPKEHSTGGKQRMGKISKTGNERLRQLLVVGATAVVRFATPGSKSASAWLVQLVERKPRKVAAVALANKNARIIWARPAKVPGNRLRSAGTPGEGDDVAWGGVSASAGRCLNQARLPGVEGKQARDGNRSNHRATKSVNTCGHDRPPGCLDVIRGTHLG